MRIQEKEAGYETSSSGVEGVVREDKASIIDGRKKSFSVHVNARGEIMFSAVHDRVVPLHTQGSFTVGGSDSELGLSPVPTVSILSHTAAGPCSPVFALSPAADIQHKRH